MHLHEGSKLALADEAYAHRAAPTGVGEAGLGGYAACLCIQSDMPKLLSFSDALRVSVGQDRYLRLDEVANGEEDVCENVAGEGGKEVGLILEGRA